MDNCFNFEWRLDTSRGTHSSARLSLDWGLDSHSATLVGHSIYVYGGRQQTKLSRDLRRLNYATLRWTRVLPRSSSLPPRRHLHAACLIDDCIYVIGGASRVGTLEDMWKYDLVLQAWQQIRWTGERLNSSSGTSAFYVDGRREIVVLGAGALGKVMVFDPQIRHMYYPETTGQTPEIGPSHRACASGDRVFVLRTDRAAFVWSLHLLIARRQMQWTTLARPGENPSLRLGCSLSYSFGRLLLFGGKSQHDYFSELHVFNVSEGSWERAAKPEDDEAQGSARYNIAGKPSYCRRHAAVALPNKLLLIGGTAFGTSPLSKLRVIQPRTESKSHRAKRV